MALEIEAVYERGVLKLQRELPLEDGQKVQVTIDAGGAVRRLAGLIPWTEAQDELRRYLSDPGEGVVTLYQV